jgi:transcriptional regulator with XRE-family HTH domain
VPTSGSPTVRRLRLAAELHRLREQAGLTGDQAAEELGWSPSKISRIENARSGVSVPDTRKLLGLYEVTGTHHEELVALAREASRKGWWEAYSELPEDLVELIGMEAEATSAWNWEPQVIPGLLQTEAYARGVVGAWQEWATVTPAAVERRVEARRARQRRLEGEDPLRLWAVMDESVLSRRFGGNAVMRSQVQHLIDISQRDNVTLRVLSLDGRQPVGTGAFVYLRFPSVYDVQLDDRVVLEQHTKSFFVRHEEEVIQYEKAFDSLYEASLPPAKSRDVMANAVKKIWS